MATAVKQRSLGFSEGLPARLTSVTLHAFVCFAVFDDISLSYLSIVCACFVPAERPSLGHFLLFHCLVLPLLTRLFLHSLPPVKRETTRMSANPKAETIIIKQEPSATSA